MMLPCPLTRQSGRRVERNKRRERPQRLKLTLARTRTPFLAPLAQPTVYPEKKLVT